MSNSSQKLKTSVFSLTGQIKSYYLNYKNDSFIKGKVDDVITTIWRHYKYKPSDEQLRIEISYKLSGIDKKFEAYSENDNV
ncbi:hypothetical protein M0Q97_09435 [Candidatus Dojkabacteria bacterium]|nr:hypothetical protein [Candidatus Dojkabacteria bacterium]